MKIQTRLALLFILCFALLLGALGLYYSADMQRLNSLFALEAVKTEESFDRIQSLLAASLATFANDYTYWDEMVSFVQSGDEEWALTNLDSSLSTYQITALWVYNREQLPVYATDDTGDRTFRSLPLQREAIGKVFEKDRFCHFFVSTPQGVMEIRGATIHPSADKARVTDPAGYFFAGRLWDSAYLEKLSYLTGTQVVLDQSLQLKVDVMNPRKGLVIFSRQLRFWNALPVANLIIRSEAKPIRLYASLTRKMLAAFIVIFAAILAFLILSLVGWVIMPMRAILHALTTADVSGLGRFAKKQDELGSVATLIERFFRQRGQLFAEIEERKKAEEALRASEERFMKAFNANPSLMAISDFETGRVIAVNDAYSRIVGYSRDQVVGRTSIELGVLTPEMRDRFVSPLQHDQPARNIDIVLRDKDGVERNMLISAEKMQAGGEWIMLSVAVDITSRVRAEEELKKKMNELERFNKLAVGRELKMVELKEKIRQLEERHGAC